MDPWLISDSLCQNVYQSRTLNEFDHIFSTKLYFQHKTILEFFLKTKLLVFVLKTFITSMCCAEGFVYVYILQNVNEYLK